MNLSLINFYLQNVESLKNVVFIVTTTIEVVSLQCHTHSVSLNNSLYRTVVAAWLNFPRIISPREVAVTLSVVTNIQHRR